MTPPAAPDVDVPRSPARPRPFTRSSLLTLLAVWYPLNPVVCAWLAAKFSEVFLAGNLHVGLPAPHMALFALTVTILGPFTALIEGRNRLDCWRYAFELLPWCAGPLVTAALLQCLWRPSGWVGQAVRLVLLGLGSFAWLAGGLLSVLFNSG